MNIAQAKGVWYGGPTFTRIRDTEFGLHSKIAFKLTRTIICFDLQHQTKGEIEISAKIGPLLRSGTATFGKFRVHLSEFRF